MTNQEAITYLTYFVDHPNPNGSCDKNTEKTAIEVFKMAIKALEERPKREWIAHQEDRWIYAKCPECAYINNVKTNFCPNCGIPMEVKSEQH